MTEFPVQKYGHVVHLPREQAIAYGLVQPTEAERRQQDEERARYEQRRADATAAWSLFVAALDAVAEPVARAVLALHARNDDGECEGCDMDGYDAERPYWPCRTIVTVAEALGIDVPPDLDMAEQHH